MRCAVTMQEQLSHGAGDALQKCVTALLNEDVPNFIEDPRGYLTAINYYLKPRGLALIKIKLPLEFPIPVASPLCLLTGKSPRGTHKHVVVGRIVSDTTNIVVEMDPHPSRDGLDGDLDWVGLMVKTF